MPKLSGQPLICDASSLISLTDSGFLPVLYFLKKKYGGNFFIPPSVEYECVAHPRMLRVHAIHAIRIQKAVNDGIIEVISPPGRSHIDEIKWVSNNIFSTGGTPIRLFHEGEIEVLALSAETGVSNLLVDERTTRMMAEDHESLRRHLEGEFHRTIEVDEKNLSVFLRMTANMRFFRSSELLLLAYEKGFFRDFGELEKDAVEAALYKLKYSGCAVGFKELEAYIDRHVQNP